MKQFRVKVDKRPAFTYNPDRSPYMLWYVALEQKVGDSWQVYTWWFKEKDKEKDDVVAVLKRVHRLTDADVV